MVTVRYRGGYSFVHNEHGELSEGDVVDVGDYTFEQFEQMFTRVDEETDHTAASDGDAEPEPDAEAEAEPEPWDEEEWLDGDYTDRADKVRTGAVDEFLDEIEDVETSSTVTDAVAARREELDGEA